MVDNGEVRAVGRGNEGSGMRYVGYGRGPEKTECSGLDARSAVGGDEGEAESMRVTKNHLEIMD